MWTARHPKSTFRGAEGSAAIASCWRLAPETNASNFGRTSHGSAHFCRRVVDGGHAPHWNGAWPVWARTLFILRGQPREGIAFGLRLHSKQVQAASGEMVINTYIMSFAVLFISNEFPRDFAFCVHGPIRFTVNEH